MLELVNSRIHELALEDFMYLKVSTWNPSIERAVKDYDGIVLTATDTKNLTQSILAVRTHRDPAIFLKPLFFLTENNSSYTIHTDGIFDKDKSNELSKRINNRQH